MADSLLLSALWCGWMVAGATLDERGLAADVGDVQGRCQQQVPMLLPWRGPAPTDAQ